MALHKTDIHLRVGSRRPCGRGVAGHAGWNVSGSRPHASALAASRRRDPRPARPHRFLVRRECATGNSKGATVMNPTGTAGRLSWARMTPFGFRLEGDLGLPLDESEVAALQAL